MKKHFLFRITTWIVLVFFSLQTPGVANPRVVETDYLATGSELRRIRHEAVEKFLRLWGVSSPDPTRTSQDPALGVAADDTVQSTFSGDGVLSHEDAAGHLRAAIQGAWNTQPRFFTVESLSGETPRQPLSHFMVNPEGDLEGLRALMADPEGDGVFVPRSLDALHEVNPYDLWDQFQRAGRLITGYAIADEGVVPYIDYIGQIHQLLLWVSGQWTEDNIRSRIIEWQRMGYLLLEHERAGRISYTVRGNIANFVTSYATRQAYRLIRPALYLLVEDEVDQSDPLPRLWVVLDHVLSNHSRISGNERRAQLREIRYAFESIDFENRTSGMNGEKVLYHHSRLSDTLAADSLAGNYRARLITEFMTNQYSLRTPKERLTAAWILSAVADDHGIDMLERFQQEFVGSDDESLRDDPRFILVQARKLKAARETGDGVDEVLEVLDQELQSFFQAAPAASSVGSSSGI